MKELNKKTSMKNLIVFNILKTLANDAFGFGKGSHLQSSGQAFRLLFGSEWVGLKSKSYSKEKNT